MEDILKTGRESPSEAIIPVGMIKFPHECE